LQGDYPVHCAGYFIYNKLSFVEALQGNIKIMAQRKKPETPEEVKIDIEEHPDRGMAQNPVTGEMESVVNFETVEIKITIPKELHRLLLRVGAAMGMTRPQIIITALAKYVTEAGVLYLLDDHELNKSSKFRISHEEVRSKIYGGYKRVAREIRSRVEKS
jgi:hypothetical protein